MVRTWCWIVYCQYIDSQEGQERCTYGIDPMNERMDVIAQSRQKFILLPGFGIRGAPYSISRRAPSISYHFSIQASLSHCFTMASYIRIINHLVLEDDPNDRKPSPIQCCNAAHVPLAIARCGPSAIRLLENSLYHLLVPTSRPLRTRDAFATLLHLADERINTLPFHAVGAEWLRLYVDATIGLVVAQVLANDDEPPWREWIRKLDMAIVVAGAVGKGRDEVIQRLIKLVQADYAADHLARYRRMVEYETTIQDVEQEPRERRRITGPQRLHYAANAVPELAPPPSSNAYRTTHHTQPFIIRRFASPSSSPAISHWRSAAYLLSLVGPGRVVPVEIGASYTAKEWGQRIVPFELFLSRIGYDLSGLLPADEDELDKVDELPHGQPLYLAQHALLDQFPMLRPDVGPLPDYIYAEPGAEGYAPPGNEQGLIMNVWVGNGAGAGHGEEADEKKGNDSAGPVISPAHTVCPFTSASITNTHSLSLGPLLQLLPPDSRRKARLARTARRLGFNVCFPRTRSTELELRIGRCGGRGRYELDGVRTRHVIYNQHLPCTDL